MLHLYNSWIYWGYTDLVYDGLYVGSERHQRADHCQRPKQEEKDGGTKAPQPFQVDHQHCQYLKTECISVSMLVMVNLRNPNHTRRTGQNTIRQLRHVDTKISQPKCIDSILVCKDFCECLVWVRTLKLTYLVGQIWKKSHLLQPLLTLLSAVTRGKRGLFMLIPSGNFCQTSSHKEICSFKLKYNRS